MIHRVRASIALGAALLAGLSARQAVAEPPGGTAAYIFSCTPNGSAPAGETQTNPPGFTVDVTGYSFQVAALNIGSATSGAGAGKATFSAMTVDLPAVQFNANVLTSLTSANFSSCTLIPSTA